MQHRKCCYCEKLEEQAKYRDVEHFRPKSSYWWLAWSWDNLLFSCIDCNREWKRDQFPLAAGDQPLAAETHPPGNERPLVLDPCDPSMEPTTEIEFRRERYNGRERWVPRGLTERGRKTVEVCGLDRPSLLDLYDMHVMNLVRPRTAPCLEATHGGEDAARAVVRAWRTATRALLAPRMQFWALSFDALKVLVSAEVRARYGLELNRP